MKLLMNTTSPYARIARIALWEKGLRDVETRIVDPWGDTPELVAANSAARVPTLITDDGQALTESLLIVLWLEQTRPQPPLLAANVTADTAGAGIALGVVDAAVHTLIGRKTSGGASFDESPVGLRRRRTMIEGLKRIDARMPELSDARPGLTVFTGVVALDYVRFRFPSAEWMPRLERMESVRERIGTRPSIEETVPHD